MERITKITDKLKASPMFNLSLSSKELFHSNFLSWLGGCNDTKELFEHVIQKLSGKEFTLKGKTIGRENHNFDLSVESDDVVEILIENKVKSFPKLKQLRAFAINSALDILEAKEENLCKMVILKDLTVPTERMFWI